MSVTVRSPAHVVTVSAGAQASVTPPASEVREVVTVEQVKTNVATIERSASASVSVASSPHVVSVEARSAQVITVTPPSGRVAGIAAEDFSDEAARDSTTETLIYFGRTEFTVERYDQPEWQIYRYNTLTDATEYADGNRFFDNVWDDRESLIYWAVLGPFSDAFSSAFLKVAP